jgi:hypothetical protein
MGNAEILKITKNFMPEEQMKVWRDFCDVAVSTRSNDMAIYAKGLRYVLQFGKDRCETHYASKTTLDALEELQSSGRHIFSKVIDETKKLFGDDSEIFMAGFWVTKHLPGSRVGEHDDTDQGINDHFKYSAVLYLNTLSDTGQLIFTDLGVEIKPEAGDLVVFKSLPAGNHKVDRIDEDRYTLAFWMTEIEEFSI